MALDFGLNIGPGGTYRRPGGLIRRRGLSSPFDRDTPDEIGPSGIGPEGIGPSNEGNPEEREVDYDPTPGFVNLPGTPANFAKQFFGMASFFANPPGFVAGKMADWAFPDFSLADMLGFGRDEFGLNVFDRNNPFDDRQGFDKGTGFDGKPTPDPTNVPDFIDERGEPTGEFGEAPEGPGEFDPAADFDDFDDTGADHDDDSDAHGDEEEDEEAGFYHGGLVQRSRLKGPNPPGPDDGSANLDIGEFVLPDRAVAAIGGGNHRRGAKRLQRITDRTSSHKGKGLVGRRGNRR